MPLVSVVMPSYNHERYISEAVDSVLSQSMNDLELIILDDGSSDASRRLIEDFAKKDARVRAMFHEKNMGIARTVNEGLQAAGSEFIASIASDDVWHRDKLRRQLEVIEGDGEVVVWAEGEVIDSQGMPTGELFSDRHKSSTRKKSGELLEELLKRNLIFGSTLLFSRRALGDTRFNEELKYLNDYQFVVDMASHHEYRFLPQPLARYRVHRASTNRDKRGFSLDGVMIASYFLDEYSNRMSSRVKARVYFNMGKDHLYLGNMRQAVRSFYCAVRLDPSLELVRVVAEDSQRYLSKRLGKRVA